MIKLHPFAQQATAGQAHLRIMETTDLHMHLYPYDYYADQPSDLVGLSRTATLIKSLRASAQNSVLVDNGDFLQGTPMGDYVLGDAGFKDGDVHPIIAAMNLLTYDAATIGNHEFNYGLDFLDRVMAGADFDVVLANVAKSIGVAPVQDKTLFKPYTLLDRQITDTSGAVLPIRIGLIGLTPPQAMKWDRRHLEGRVVVRDMVETARAYVPQMREAGADLIIALSHSGIGNATWQDGMENATVPLAALEGIDAIVCGHSHLLFPSPTFANLPFVDVARGTVHGKPTVMGGFWGSHLGVIDLLIAREAGQWRVLGSDVSTHPITKPATQGPATALVEDAPDVIEAVAQAHHRTLEFIRRPIGQTSKPLHSFFSLVAEDAALQLIAKAQIAHLQRLVQNGPYADLPVLSVATPFKVGGRSGPDHFTFVPAGPIAIKNVADLYVYPNAFCGLRVTGYEVRQWLERAAGLFNQIAPGAEDAPLINPVFPIYNFDIVFGLTYEIDLSQPSRYNAEGVMTTPDAQRVTTLQHNGQPVADDMTFLLATNSYRASGGGDFPGVDASTIVADTTDSNRDILQSYIAAQGVLDAEIVPNWSFAPMPCPTSVVFNSSPKAETFLQDVPRRRIEAAGLGAQGFAQFRLWL